jgi:EthD domain
MVRVLVLYEQVPDPERYARYAALCERVPRARFRHGRIFGAPTGEERFRYMAEFEFPDMETFLDCARSPEFAATGHDAETIGVPFTVQFAELGD